MKSPSHMPSPAEEQRRENKSTTSFSNKITDTDIKNRVQKFYDLGSPYYYQLYSEHIHDGYYITGKESKKEAQENLIKLLAVKAGITKKAKILDVGCGMGGTSMWLAEHLEAKTTGITISPVQVEMANKLAQERGTDSSFLLMDANDMRFDRTFDVIWAVAMMTHLPHQQDFLKSATGLLKEHGKLVIFDWMLADDAIDTQNDRDVSPVAKGMLLASMHSLNAYLAWLIALGYRITYSEDITANTVKTWDDALAAIKDPLVWKLAAQVTAEERKEVLSFFKSIRPMKLAMKRGKIIAGAIVAEKFKAL